MKKRKKIKKIIVNNETIGIDVYNIDDGDTIVVTLDKNIYRPAEAMEILENFKKFFPNNKILVKCIGIDMEVVKK